MMSRLVNTVTSTNVRFWLKADNASQLDGTCATLGARVTLELVIRELRGRFDP